MKDPAVAEGVRQAYETLAHLLDGDFTPERVGRRRQQFEAAVDNAVRHVKRSLLDFIDLQLKTTTLPPATTIMLGMLEKRVHNDVSVMKSKVDAAFSIYTSGGEIPPFGRTAEQMSGNGGGGERRR